ncbi:protein LHCP TRANSLOCATION DEFECT [Cryptomeria japonica]|uniref:protein LHCP TRANSLOCATION DEFECT n=1 Tax=Cryptomeria japonica TaxID=3369 RepID=UPI0025ACF491|nr:protein LHCP TRANSLOCATION DEFECT [Cryptomeria japonica]
MACPAPYLGLSRSNICVARSSHNINASLHLRHYTSSFLGQKTLGRCDSSTAGLRTLKVGMKSHCRRVTCWFNFGKSAEGAGVYGTQAREDFDRDDVEQYFNYMGMLAVEGSYDKMEALLNKNIPPIDILLLLAASEGDKPKIEELMRAGADYTVTDVEGRNALDRAADEEIKNLIANFPK